MEKRYIESAKDIYRKRISEIMYMYMYAYKHEEKEKKEGVVIKDT